MTDLTGTTLGRYKIEFLLAETPVTAVYRGFDINLERIVVVHIVKTTLVDTTAHTQNFAALVRKAVRLEHPGLLRVYDFVQLDGYVCVVTEYIEGPVLAQLLDDMRASRRWLPQDEAIRIVQQTALAVDYAYANGVFAAQVTPESIKFKANLLPLAQHDFRPVITDLGLFLPLSPGAEVAWMQADNRHFLHRQIRDLGVLLYILLTGQAIDPAQATEDTIRRGLQQYPAIPATLATVLQHVFGAQASTRFPSIQTFVDAMSAPSAGTPKSVISLAEQYEKSSEVFQAPPEVPKEISAPPPFVPPPAPPPSAPTPPTAPAPSADDLYDAETSIELPLPHRPSPQIVVTDEDGSQRTYDLSKGSLTIGRANDNDCVIEDQRASRQHAKVEWDGAQCLITDQNSRNGTYLNEERLTAFVAKVWTDQIVRIGGRQLQVRMSLPGSTATPVTPQVAPQAPAALPPSPTLPPEPVRPPQKILLTHQGYHVERSDLKFLSNSQTLALYSPDYRYSVAPGETKTIPLTALNLGASKAALLLAAEGPWITLSSDRLNLLPQAQASVEIAVAPPRDTRTRAGRYRVTLLARNAAQGSQSTSLQFEVRVGAIADLAVRAEPEQVTVGEDIVISVENLGNEVRTYHLMWWDESKTLTFEPAGGKLTVAPGQSGEIKVRPLAPERRWLGGARRYSIRIQVTPDVGDNKVTSVEVINRSRLGI